MPQKLENKAAGEINDRDFDKIVARALKEDSELLRKLAEV